MKTIIASFAALIGTVYADPNEVCGGPPVTDSESAELEQCWTDGWTASCYRIEARESCYANYDHSDWDGSFQGSGSSTGSSTGSTDWGSSTEWSIDISGSGAEYVEPEETCADSWDWDLSALDNCLYRDWYPSTACESEWYSYYGYDSSDQGVCQGERAQEEGCRYFNNWYMDVLYCPKTQSGGSDWENAGGIEWSWEIEDQNSNTEEYTCEGEECDVEITIGTVIIALIVLGGIGFGVWWILTQGALLDLEFASFFMENSFTDKINFDM